MRSLTSCLPSVLVLLLGCGENRPSPEAKSNSHPNASRSTPTVGSEAWISRTGKESRSERFFAGIDRANYEALTKAFAAKDHVGLAELISDHKVIVVSAGTKVLVLELSPPLVKVRILDGTHLRKAVWVSQKDVSSTAPALLPYRAGTLGVLGSENPEEERPMLASDRQTLLEYLKLIDSIAKNEVFMQTNIKRVEKLMETGSLFHVPKLSKAQIVSDNGTELEVKVLSGARVDENGWLLMRWFTPDLP